MDFRFTPTQEALRRDIRAFLQQELPPGHPEAHIIPEEGSDELWEFALAFTKKLSRRGWYTATWPREWGGLGWGAEEAIILSSELAYHGAATVNSLGLATAGMLFAHGTDEQLREHLPGIASCEVIWAEGYSEPDAGSDLASLKSTAIRDGDEYVLNGGKVWTGGAHRAQWMFVFARTDPAAEKHQGISYLLVDLKSPGITLTPLPSMEGLIMLCQEFFDNVRVPRANLLGEENQGWRDRGGGRGSSPVARRAHGAPIGAAATGVGNPHTMRRHLEHLIAYCQETKDGGVRLFDLPVIRHKLADIAIGVEIACLRSYRGAAAQAFGRPVGVAELEASGLFTRELLQRLARTGVEVLGLYGALGPENPRWAQLRGWFTDSYMNTVPATIYGGTVEIHRGILANRGLGLPRS